MAVIAVALDVFSATGHLDAAPMHEQLHIVAVLYTAPMYYPFSHC